MSDNLPSNLDACPCGYEDEEGIAHSLDRHHRNLDEVGVYCLRCDDWCDKWGPKEGDLE